MTGTIACVFLRAGIPCYVAHRLVLFEESLLLPPLFTPCFMHLLAALCLHFPKYHHRMQLCVMEFYSGLGVWKGG